MRAIIPSALLALVLSASGGAAYSQSGIPWLYDYQQARALAQREQRLMLIHFYTDWCGPCRKLEQTVFPNPDVSRAVLASYVAVKINAEQVPDLARYYEVDRYPTDVIADSQGRVIFRTVSPPDPVQYTRLLNGVASDYGRQTPVFPTAARMSPGGLPAATDPQASRWNENVQDYAAAQPPPNAQSPGAGYQRDPAWQMDDARLAGNRNWGQAGNGDANASPVPSTAFPSTERRNSYADAWQDQADGGQAPPSAYDRQSRWTPPGDQAGGGIDPRGPSSSDPAAGSAYPSANNAPPSGAGQVNPYVTNPATPPAAVGPTGQPVGIDLPALDGCCPVTLAENEKWLKGDARWGVKHRGFTYLLASQQHQQQFLADPDRFTPVLSGYDPTAYIDEGQLVLGLRRHGMWFKGEVYLFSSEASLDRFTKSPDLYAQRTHEIMRAAGR